MWKRGRVFLKTEVGFHLLKKKQQKEKLCMLHELKISMTFAKRSDHLYHKVEAKHFSCGAAFRMSSRGQKGDIEKYLCAAAGVHRNCGRRGEVPFTFSTKGCRGVPSRHLTQELACTCN